MTKAKPTPAQGLRVELACTTRTLLYGPAGEGGERGS